MLPHGFVILPAERGLEVVLRAGAREEALADDEAESVIVGVDEPRGHVHATNARLCPPS